MRHFISIISSFALIFTSCVQREQFHKESGAVWATTFNITYSSSLSLGDSMQRVMAEVEQSLSPFNASSLISRINRNETDTTDGMVRRVFLASQDVNSRSGGMFDPTVSPLINLWGFGYREGLPAPCQEQIDSALVSVGIDSCSLDGNRMVKKDRATEFNFSAITKGYGCDLVGEMLKRNGCSDYMVEIGGEMALSGHNPNGEEWHVMIDAPIPNDTMVIHDRMALIKVTDCGIATSGNYRNFKKIGGQQHGHTISPVTGWPVATTTLSVTVIASDAMTADALATACMAMPLDDAIRMIEDHSPATSALFVTAGADGEWQLTPTSRFPEIHR